MQRMHLVFETDPEQNVWTVLKVEVEKLGKASPAVHLLIIGMTIYTI